MKEFIKAHFKSFKRFFRFSLSSFTAFLVDYTIFILLTVTFAERITFMNLTLANVAARIVSSTVNFNINRRLVFKSSKSLIKSAAEFYSLAALVLVGNSIVLNFLAHGLDINHYLAKILTEMLFFLLNFTIQNFFVFKKKK